MIMKTIENVKTDIERAFYASQDAVFSNVTIDGPVDGESAFKECQNIEVKNSQLFLRYPFWHDNNLKVKSSILNSGCRAPIWYSNSIEFSDVEISGVKAFRECSNIVVQNCKFISEEAFWSCSNINIENTQITAVYGFMRCNDANLIRTVFNGKYSFQYTKNLEIVDSILDTKDAFWHSENVTVKNSIIKGEYLGWYSKNLTLINCTITGTQPLCYATGLKIIDCTMEDCDLAFEYSEVNGNIKKKVKSIKNPLAGKLEIEDCEEIIIDQNDRSHGKFILIKKE